MKMSVVVNHWSLFEFRNFSSEFGCREPQRPRNVRLHFKWQNSRLEFHKICFISAVKTDESPRQFQVHIAFFPMKNSCVSRTNISWSGFIVFFVYEGVFRVPLLRWSKYDSVESDRLTMKYVFLFLIIFGAVRALVSHSDRPEGLIFLQLCPRDLPSDHRTLSDKRDQGYDLISKLFC